MTTYLVIQLLIQLDLVNKGYIYNSVTCTVNISYNEYWKKEACDRVLSQHFGTQCQTRFTGKQNARQLIESTYDIKYYTTQQIHWGA